MDQNIEQNMYLTLKYKYLIFYFILKLSMRMSLQHLPKFCLTVKIRDHK